jgi:hypothetical protein
MGRLVDLTGQKFGRLKVERRAENDKGRRARWLCWCDCGNRESVIVTGYDLRTGHTHSCGCWKVEAAVQRLTKHNHARQGKISPEHRAWASMKSRCLNPNHPKYKYWGGRGIKIHPPWVSSFEAFFAYVGPKPSPKHSVDRYPNRDGDYVPGNVRWATQEEQRGNRENCHHIQLPDGRVVWREQFGRELGLASKRLDQLAHAAKRSIARGATTPVEQATKVAIQVTFWMIAADMLRGHPDPPQAARDFARFVRGKGDARPIQGNTQR